MSRHKKKNRNNSRKEEYTGQKKAVAEEKSAGIEEDYTQELNFDLSDFDEEERVPVEEQTEKPDSMEETVTADVEESVAPEEDVQQAGDSADTEGTSAEETSAEETAEAEQPVEKTASEEKTESKPEKSGKRSKKKSKNKNKSKSENKPEDKSEDKSEDNSEEKTEEKTEEKSDDKSEKKSEDGSEDKSAKKSSDEKEDPDDGEDDFDDEDTKKSGDSKVSRNALREQSENERVRREARHKRRLRQQILAYLLLIVILAAIGCGVYFGIRFFVDASRARQAEALAQEQAALQQQLEEEAAAAQAAQQQAVEELPPAATVEDLGATPAQRLDEIIESEIANMTLEEKVQAIMFITPESITGVDRVVIAGEGTEKALSDFNPGGIVYAAKNVTSADQFSTMMTNTLGMVTHPVFLATTETGLDESGLIKAGVIESVLTPSQAAEGGNVEEVVNTGIAIGNGLQSVGITVDFAPLADLAVTGGGVMSNTCYGSDAASVTPYVTGMADGLYQSGVIACYKYFPSLAATTQNPAGGRSVSDRTLEDFRSNEFQVWLSAINAGARMIQMSNVIYPSIDSDSLPSTISDKTVTGVLRDELKYDGVIISGPLSDAAISSYYTASESAVMALKAGCDMIYSSPDPRAAAEGIIEAVGSGVISEERINDALIRIYRIRYADTLEQFRAEYEANAMSMGVDLTGVQY